jgi:hypothetical protein
MFRTASTTAVLIILGFAGHQALAQQPDAMGMPKPGHQKPSDQHPGDQHPGDQKPGDQKPGDQHPGHQHPGDQKPDQEKPDQDDGKQSEPKRKALFNLVCYYKHEANPEGFKTCKVVSRFEKAVTPDGGEVTDESPELSEGQGATPETPTFLVECNNARKWHLYGRRVTDLLSTTISATPGPLPAIYIPRAMLHVESHISDSYLDIDTGVPENRLRLPGKCYIWASTH